MFMQQTFLGSESRTLLSFARTIVIDFIVYVVILNFRFR